MATGTSSQDPDEVVEISKKNYQKITETFEKEGYREGVTEGQNSIFQQSFDNGYEDGFKTGFLLGLKSKEKAGRGNCAVCAKPALMEKPETEAREIHQKQFESQEQEK